jgi:hypothetical protein
LLELRIQQLERLPEDIEMALERLKVARLNNKERFDKTHRLRMKKIEEGDWVLVFDSSLENQHSTVRKFAKRWFGPYVVIKVHSNGTYSLRELDGTLLRIPIAGKKVKVFKRRDGRFDHEELAELLDPNSQTDEDETPGEYDPIDDAADHNEVHEED